MKVEKIGIIGGTGVMGEMFERVFKQEGYVVYVSGLDTTLSEEELVEASDVVILSVPIDKTLEVFTGSSRCYGKISFCLTLLPLRAILSRKWLNRKPR